MSPWMRAPLGKMTGRRDGAPRDAYQTCWCSFTRRKLRATSGRGRRQPHNCKLVTCDIESNPPCERKGDWSQWGDDPAEQHGSPSRRRPALPCCWPPEDERPVLPIRGESGLPRPPWRHQPNARTPVAGDSETMLTNGWKRTSPGGGAPKEQRRAAMGMTARTTARLASGGGATRSSDLRGTSGRRR